MLSEQLHRLDSQNIRYHICESKHLGSISFWGGMRRTPADRVAQKFRCKEPTSYLDFSLLNNELSAFKYAFFTTSFSAISAAVP